MPVADLKALAEELDEDCARELAGAFLEDAAIAMAGIDEAIQSRNANDLKAQSHGLKGCCRTIKAALAEQVSSEMESAAIAQDWDKVSSIHPQLKAMYDQVCNYIQSYLQA